MDGFAQPGRDAARPWAPGSTQELQSLLDWASWRLGGLPLHNATAIGVIRGGRIIAALPYTNFHPGHMIEIGIVSIDPRWCTRRVLTAAFSYPFRQLGVRRLQATTSRRNKAARGLMERLGFKFEGMARQGWHAGGDAAVYSMLPGECKWLEDISHG